MSVRTLQLTDDLQSYVVAHGTPPDAIVQDLITETRAALPDDFVMQVGPDQAAFLTLLTRLLNVTHAVEVGTFTGLSALSIARGLAPGGQLICLDVSEEFTSVARRYWERAGVTDRIDLRIAPASQSLRELPVEPHLDLAFIDADKTGYPDYWAEIVPRMRPGGLIVVDNVLRNGRVLQPEDTADHAIVAFNKLVVADDRVDVVMLPLADGLTLARRR